MCTPDKFIPTDDNVTALTQCCFQNVHPMKPTMWQTQVYLGEVITNTERLSITDSENSITKNCVVYARKEVNNDKFIL